MTGQGAVNRDELRRTSAPALLCERSRSTPDRSHSAPSTSASIASAPGATTRCWSRARRALAALGLAQGRARRHHGRCLRGVDDLRSGRAVARRHRLRHLSDGLGRARSNIRCATAAPSIFIAEDQEYVDKILPLADRLPACAGSSWSIDASAMFGYEHPKLMSYREIAGGRAASRTSIGSERVPPRSSPDDPAFIVYTSGTTGHPKGALVAHGKHLAAAANIVRALSDARREGSSARSSICRSATCSAATSR